ALTVVLDDRLLRRASNASSCRAKVVSANLRLFNSFARADLDPWPAGLAAKWGLLPALHIRSTYCDRQRRNETRSLSLMLRVNSGTDCCCRFNGAAENRPLPNVAGAGAAGAGLDQSAVAAQVMPAPA